MDEEPYMRSNGATDHGMNNIRVQTDENLRGVSESNADGCFDKVCVTATAGELPTDSVQGEKNAEQALLTSSIREYIPRISDESQVQGPLSNVTLNSEYSIRQSKDVGQFDTNRKFDAPTPERITLFLDTRAESSRKISDKTFTRAPSESRILPKSLTKSFFPFLSPNKKSSGDAPRRAWIRSRVAPLRGRGKSILIYPEEKAERAEKLSKTKRLRKVHFHLPKASSQRVIAQALDPKSPTIRRWQSVMLLPLAYELWAFPYRLALGAPSTRSKVFAADLACDTLFLVDIFVALCTAVPADRVGDAAITSFRAIARRYFATAFPIQFLPCTLYWIATPICAHYLALLCPDFSEARRGGGVPGGQNPWDSEYAGGGAAGGAAASVWECVVGNSRAWPVWVWWLSTLPRVLPRALRLAAYFKAMESDLVRSSDPRIHIACLVLYNVITNDCCTSDLHVVNN